MTPTQARAFLAVALNGSFSRAARSLGVSQPTVTNQVRQIESRYGVELFRRGGRGAALTPVGESLLPFVRRTFASFEEATAYLDDVRGARRGELRIGSYGPYDVVKLVARYRARFPEVVLTVDIANSQTLADKLLKYELDVAVLGRIEPMTEFHTLPFRNPPLVVIAPRVAPWTARKSVSVRELQGQTLVCREPGSAARVAHDHLFENAKVPASRIVEFGSREGVVAAVAEGIGIGTIFDEGLIPQDRVVKLRLAGRTITSRVDVVCLAERRSNRLIAAFLAVTEETTRSSSLDRPQ